MKKFFLSCLLMVAALTASAGDYAHYYQQLPVQMQQVVAPQIPELTVRLTDFGAKGDGVTDNTEAFQKAISQLSKQGGGHLVVPAGVWLTGLISLKDNIDLHLERNAIVMATPDKLKHLKTDKQTGERDSRATPLINASKRKNISITGEGIIDGNGKWWRPVKRGKVSDTEWNQFRSMGGTVSEKGDLWYPFGLKNFPNITQNMEKEENLRMHMVRFTDCENVLVSGVTLQNSPRFHFVPQRCRNVIIDGVTVRCPWNAQNGDGIDFTDVNIGLIVNNTVDVGDDGICMKSSVAKKEAPANGCEDIIVENNTVFHAHGGFVLGSNTTSGIRRMVVRKNRYCSTDTGLRFKSGLGRGGKTEKIYIQDIIMSDIAKEAIVFQCDYSDHDADGSPKRSATLTEKQKKRIPEFQDIHINNVICMGCKTGLKAKGLEGLDCVHDITIDNTTIVYRKKASEIDEKTTNIASKARYVSVSTR